MGNCAVTNSDQNSENCYRNFEAEENIFGTTLSTKQNTGRIVENRDNFDNRRNCKNISSFSEEFEIVEYKNLQKQLKLLEEENSCFEEFQETSRFCNENNSIKLINAINKNDDNKTEKGMESVTEFSAENYLSEEKHYCENSYLNEKNYNNNSKVKGKKNKKINGNFIRNFLENPKKGSDLRIKIRMKKHEKKENEIEIKETDLTQGENIKYFLQDLDSVINTTQDTEPYNYKETNYLNKSYDLPKKTTLHKSNKSLQILQKKQKIQNNYNRAMTKISHIDKKLNESKILQEKSIEKKLNESKILQEKSINIPEINQNLSQIFEELNKFSYKILQKKQNNSIISNKNRSFPIKNSLNKPTPNQKLEDLNKKLSLLNKKLHKN